MLAATYFPTSPPMQDRMRRWHENVGQRNDDKLCWDGGVDINFCYIFTRYYGEGQV